MKNLILLSISAFFATEAFGEKAFVKMPDGSEQFLDVAPGAEFSPSVTVLCDERKDGAACRDVFPGATTVSRDGAGKIVVTVDETKKAKILSDKAKADSDAATEKTTCDAAKAKVLAKTATAAEVRDALRCVLLSK